MFMVRYLGDNLVPMTPKAEERMEDIVKLNNDWFECIFEDIKPWSASCVAGYKLVWVKCYGLSLPLWSKECFLKVVGEVATLVMLMKPHWHGNAWSMLGFGCACYNHLRQRCLRGFRLTVLCTILTSWRRW